MKLRKTIKNGNSVISIHDYISGIEYKNKVLEAIYNSEGRLYFENGSSRYEFNIKDHLGNSRVCFTDIDGDGVIEIADNELLEESHYYPFGLEQKGAFSQNLGRENKYVYNGKELDSDFGLNWYHYGARMYDPAIGRFPSVDRFAEKFSFQTPYAYAGNNPISFIDVNGDSLKVNFVGEFAQHAENKLYGVVNQALEGQFVLSPDSDKNLSIVPIKGKGDVSKLSKQGKAFYDEMVTILHTEGNAEINVDYATSKVHTGRFDIGTMDMADVLQFNSDASELGGTQIGKITHEFVEQHAKQVRGETTWESSHPRALRSENNVNNSRRYDDPSKQGLNSGVQSFTRDGRTVTNRISLTSGGFFNSDRRVIKVTKR